VTVPDLSPGPGSTALGVAQGRPADPILDALEEALATLAELSHHGLHHLDHLLLGRLEEAATRLNRVGLRDGAALLRTVLTTRQERGAAATTAAWTDAQLFLAISAELHAEGTTD
jgi:hypothetical protein